LPFTTPATWSTNETATAAKFNAQIRDNIGWLATDKFRCKAVRTAAQSILSQGSPVTPVAFNAADEFDVGSMHDPATNNTRITVPTGGAGVYAVTANVTFQGNSSGRRLVSLLKNGVTEQWGWSAAPDTIGTTRASVASFMQLIATDYVELGVLQTSGVSLNVDYADLTLVWEAT
jgi:hypothetical protein